MNDKNLTIALFALLERENAVSIPQIAKLLDSDEETIWRLLDELVFAYDAIALRLELGETYAYLMRNETSQILRLSRNETGVLLDALEAHGFAAGDELVDKILASKGFFDEAESGSGIPLRTVSYSVPATVMEQLASACEDEEHHVVRIEYQKEGARTPEMRDVEPSIIASSGNTATLEAYDQARQAWRTFRIDRIKSVRVLDATYAPHAREAQERAANALLRFADGALPQDWPGLKQVRELEDGGVEAKIPWYGSLWLPKMIAGRGGQVTALEPPELVEATRAYVEGLLAETER